MLTAQPPQSLAAGHVRHADRQVLRPDVARSGLASREGQPDATSYSPNCPPSPASPTTEEERLALLSLWLAQWSTPARGIWFPSMTQEWWRQKGGVKPHSGKFQTIDRWLGTPAAKKIFKECWLPTILPKFCEVGGRQVPAARGQCRARARRASGATASAAASRSARSRDRPSASAAAPTRCARSIPRRMRCSRPARATTGTAPSAL